MKAYVALYRDDTLRPADAPLAFACMADDGDHAEEQCTNAYPDAEVVWTVETGDIDAAYADYWGNI